MNKRCSRDLEVAIGDFKTKSSKVWTGTEYPYSKRVPDNLLTLFEDVNVKRFRLFTAWYAGTT